MAWQQHHQRHGSGVSKRQYQQSAAEKWRNAGENKQLAMIHIFTVFYAAGGVYQSMAYGESGGSGGILAAWRKSVGSVIRKRIGNQQ